MKITVNKHDILDVLSKIQGITGRKSNLAITSCVLVTAVAEGVVIQVTDLETGFEGSYGASVEKEGAVAINARKFFEIVRDFPSDDIIINEVDNHWIEIGGSSSGSVEYHIVGMNPEDFPQIPALEEARLTDLESVQLKQMIEKSLVIGPTDDKRAHIIGVFFEQISGDDGNRLRMVSTDGSRLSKVDSILADDFQLDLENGAIIPKKGLQEVNKFLDTEGSVSVGFKENHFVVKKDKEIIIIRLLEGDFPKYEELVAMSGGQYIDLDKQAFQMMLKRMSILGSENYKGVIFKFTDDKLEVTSTNPDIGESKEEMTVAYDGPTMEMAFNPRYFIDAISVLADDTVNINVIEEDKPCMVRSDADKEYVCVIMPMRI
jgi:DNA polymerase-3 subunit beta